MIQTPKPEVALAMVKHVLKSRGPDVARQFVMKYSNKYPPQMTEALMRKLPVTKNSGGLIYYQNGGGADVPTATQVAQEMGLEPAPGNPPVPQAPPGMPMPPEGMQLPPGGQPMPGGAPMAPEVPMRETFADKVAKAREQIKMAKTSVPTKPVQQGPMHQMPDGTMMPGAVHTDGQGDGGVQFGEGAGTYSDAEVGPDMGPDTVDAMIPEGSFVMNAEGTAANGPEIDMMEKSIGPANFYKGSPKMIRAKLTPGERVVAPHVVAKYRQRLEAMNQGGLAMRYNQGGKVNYNVLGGFQQAGQAVQSGLNSINPDVGMALGQDIVDAAYGREGTGLKGYQEAQAEADKELASKEERAQALHESIDAATKAKYYIDNGANAVLDYKSRNYATILGEALSGFDANSIIALGETYAGEKEQAIENYIHKQFQGTKEWSAYELYQQEIRLLEVKARSLVKGGAISDNEAKAAAETIVTGRADANTIKQQLDTVINRNNVSLQNLGLPAYTSTSVGHTPTGESRGTSLNTTTSSEVQTPSVEALKPGMQFEDESGYVYTLGVSDDDKWVVTTDTGTYDLNYEEDTGIYYIDGVTGRYNLTYIGG